MSHSNLEPTGMLPSFDGPTSPVAVAALDEGRVLVSVTMSEDAYAMLDRLARSSGQELRDVIGKAFLLYEAAVEARKEGKAVGIAPNADVLDTEFVGL
jgi:hypothetical protein